VAGFDCASPSLTRYVNLASPKKSASGVKTTTSSLGSAGVPPSFTTAVPCVALTMTIDSSALSTSEAIESTSTLTGVSSSVATARSAAVGTSLTAVTVIVTVAAADVSLPSVTRYVKLSAPWKSFSGKYSKAPLACSQSVPRAGGVSTKAAKKSPSPSPSLASSPLGIGTRSAVSSATVYASSTATGAALDGSTVIRTTTTLEWSSPSVAL